jgi:hypothetical protein
MEFITSNQAIYIIYEQPAMVILHDNREICLYRLLCGGGVLDKIGEQFVRDTIDKAHIIIVNLDLLQFQTQI